MGWIWVKRHTPKIHFSPSNHMCKIFHWSRGQFCLGGGHNTSHVQWLLALTSSSCLLGSNDYTWRLHFWHGMREEKSGTRFGSWIWSLIILGVWNKRKRLSLSAWWVSCPWGMDLTLAMWPKGDVSGMLPPAGCQAHSLPHFTASCEKPSTKT